MKQTSSNLWSTSYQAQLKGEARPEKGGSTDVLVYRGRINLIVQLSATKGQQPLVACRNQIRADSYRLLAPLPEVQ